MKIFLKSVKEAMVADDFRAVIVVTILSLVVVLMVVLIKTGEISLSASGEKGIRLRVERPSGIDAGIQKDIEDINKLYRERKTQTNVSIN